MIFDVLSCENYTSLYVLINVFQKISDFSNVSLRMIFQSEEWLKKNLGLQFQILHFLLPVPMHYSSEVIVSFKQI